MNWVIFTRRQAVWWHLSALLLGSFHAQ
jgi:hypothetical protein